MRSYKDLQVWQSTIDLSVIVYKFTRYFPESEKYGLTNQIRRSAISIPSNIAEGVGRSSPDSTIYFLLVARGSLNELSTQIIIAHRLQYLSNEKFENIQERLDGCGRQLNGLIKYFRGLKSPPIKPSK